MSEPKCRHCKDTGVIMRYPRDSVWCANCGQAEALFAGDPTGFGCNRCQSTWPARMGIGCPDCGAQATHAIYPESAGPTLKEMS